MIFYKNMDFLTLLCYTAINNYILSKRETYFNMRMRKKRRSGERLCALRALFVEEKGFTGVFDSERPLRLEIGCGKGDFICALSKKEPDYNYIAMERVDDVIVVAAEKYAAARDLGCLDYHGGWRAPDGTVYKDVTWDIPVEMRGNVRFMNFDAAELCEYFEEESLDTIYANFSDPWTKNGYANRRLTHPDFLARYLKVLKTGGRFCFKTDNVELFDFSLESVENEEGFELTFVSRDLHSSERAESNIMTEYERNFSSQGIKINCLEAVKK